MEHDEEPSHRSRGFPKFRATPKWWVYFMENPIVRNGWWLGVPLIWYLLIFGGTISSSTHWKTRDSPHGRSWWHTLGASRSLGTSRHALWESAAYWPIFWWKHMKKWETLTNQRILLFGSMINIDKPEDFTIFCSLFHSNGSFVESFQGTFLHNAAGCKHGNGMLSGNSSHWGKHFLLGTHASNSFRNHKEYPLWLAASPWKARIWESLAFLFSRLPLNAEIIFCQQHWTSCGTFSLINQPSWEWRWNWGWFLVMLYQHWSSFWWYHRSLVLPVKLS